MGDVQIGDKWQDLYAETVERRTRLFEVKEIDATHATVVNVGGGRKNRIRLDRFRADDPRGYRLIERDGKPVDSKGASK